jgi:drug/metabolite transporter (DMT)-like permease
VNQNGFIERSRLIAAFAAIYLIWGSTFLALALGLETIPPLLLMGIRSLAGGLILLAIAQTRGGGLPPRRAWGPAAAGGVLLFVGGHGALAYAQQYVPSGLAAVMLATIPFWMVLLNACTGAEMRARRLTFLALLPGLGGVALIAWPEAGAASAINFKMLTLLLASAFFWAAGSIYSRGQQVAISAITLSGMQLVCGGVALVAGGALLGELGHFSALDISTVSWAGLLYLIGAGSVVGFTAYMWLLDNAPGPLVTTYTFVNPIIAVILGWRFLGERPTPQMLLGSLLVIASVVAVWRLSNPRPARNAIAEQP